jgi:hypothetical protein
VLHCHSVKDKINQTTGFAARVCRGFLPIQSGDFVARSPKPAGISEIIGQTRRQKQGGLEKKAVILDVPRHAGGRVLLYSFNPLHRHLNHGDHNSDESFVICGSRIRLLPLRKM